jgi:hypothetical protein
LESPTKLVGFICPTKKVGLILAVPGSDQKKSSIKKVGLKKSYKKGRINFLFPEILDLKKSSIN